MRKLIAISMLITVFDAYAQLSSMYGAIPTGHHITTDSVIVLSQGLTACLHDWVTEKPMYTSYIVNAVYTNPNTDRQSESYSICKKCLRHERTIYYHKWVLDKDEYQELLNKIKP